MSVPALSVVEIRTHANIGKRAVHIHQEQFNFTGAGQNIGRSEATSDIEEF